MMGVLMMDMIMFSGLVLIYLITLSGGQTCVNNPNVNQRGQVTINSGRQVIVPRARFNCSGRITNIAVSMSQPSHINIPNMRVINLPLFQVWHPTSFNSSTYNKIGEVQLPKGDFVGLGFRKSYYHVNLQINSSSQIEFHSGDVIGYYQPSDPLRLIGSISTTGYTSYSNIASSPSTSIDINNVNNTDNSYQPLIEVLFDIRCDNISVPANGNTSCSSGREGVGYDGDTCNFTCNTGYELTGSDTRTCKSDGSWSGTDTICKRVICSLPTNIPKNGVMNCSAGNHGVHYYQDICNFICDTGYNLSGSNQSMCQSNGSWSNTDVLCKRVPCSSLTDPNYGMINCSRGDDGVLSYDDTCSFTCNTGYELTGSLERTCQSNGSWSGSPMSCIIMECPSSSLPMNSMLAESCNSTYQSMCELQCQEGFTGTGDPSYVCDALSNGSSVMWIAKKSPWKCERVQCTSLLSPTNGDISCNSTDVSHYEDQCSFSCDLGYKLTGSSSRQCLSNGSWSESDVTCILHCDNFTDTIYVENSVLANDCGSEFGSVCRIECNIGYRAVGNDTFTCVSVNDTVEWWNGVDEGTVQCEIVTCEDLEIPANGKIKCNNNSQPIQYQDRCSFQCNDGYELQGSVIRQCEASGQWSGGRTQCNIRHCPDITTMVPNSRPCDTSYETICTIECEDGYSRSGDSPQYNCHLNGTEVMWMYAGNGMTCSQVPCANLSNPQNGNVTCPSNISVFQDTCTYYCDRGYQLEGNRQTSCNADGTWSSDPATCTILKCNDPEVEIANSQSVGVCNVNYGSSCSLNCSSGFTASGNGEHVCDDVNDEGTLVKWRSVGNGFSCIEGTARDNNDDLIFVSTVVGGAIGGVLLLIMIVLLVLIAAVLYIRKSQIKQKLSINVETNRYSGCDSYKRPKATTPPSQPIYYEADFSPSHKDEPSVVETALSTMDNAHVYATPYEKPVNTKPSLVNGLYEVSTISPFEMAESIKVEEQIYHTLCEDEENIGPAYSTPASDEQAIYEEYEGKRFHKLHHKDIVIHGELGSGEFGVVTCGRLTKPPHEEVEVAIKMLNPGASDKDKLRFIQEAAIMCQFDHKNVIKLYGVVTESPRMIVLEYMSRGDLRNLLLKLKSLDVHPKLPIVLLKFCQEIAAGMAYLSGKHFVHRDLATRNILVSETITCKIADFGMSRDLIDENYYVTSGGKIPLKWTAPEALHYRKYSVYSDVWSYGCVMYEIWSLGHKPFEKTTANKIIQRIESGYRLPPPPGCPRAIYRAMIKCWNPDPRSRPLFGQLVNVLASNNGYLLGWSDEDKQACSKEAMTLGAPLEAAKDLYYDLQLTYAHTQ